MINNKTVWKVPQPKQAKQIQVDKLQIEDINDFQELSDTELMAVVGGAGLVYLEAQLEKLNPQTEVGKALLKGLETLVKGAET